MGPKAPYLFSWGTIILMYSIHCILPGAGHLLLAVRTHHAFLHLEGKVSPVKPRQTIKYKIYLNFRGVQGATCVLESTKQWYFSHALRWCPAILRDVFLPPPADSQDLRLSLAPAQLPRLFSPSLCSCPLVALFQTLVPTLFPPTTGPLHRLCTLPFPSSPAHPEKCSSVATSLGRPSPAIIARPHSHTTTVTLSRGTSTVWVSATISPCVV